MARVARAAKRLKCEYSNCLSKGFGTPGTKKRHEREIHQPNQYKCGYCVYTAKRRHHLEEHKEMAHPGRKGLSVTGLSSNRGPRGSVASSSSNEAHTGAVQPHRSSSFQSPPSTQQPLPSHPWRSNGAELYSPSNTSMTHRPVGPPYGADVVAAFSSSDQHISLSRSDGQRSSQTFQLSYPPFSQRDTIPQSWQEPTRGVRPVLSGFSYSTLAAPNRATGLDYAVSPVVSPRSGSSFDTGYYHSPYSTPISACDAQQSRPTSSSYVGNAGQGGWSKQPPSNPQ